MTPVFSSRSFQFFFLYDARFQFKKKKSLPSTSEVNNVTFAAFRLPAGRLSPIFSNRSLSLLPPSFDFALKCETICIEVKSVKSVVERHFLLRKVDKNQLAHLIRPEALKENLRRLLGKRKKIQEGGESVKMPRPEQILYCQLFRV